MYRSCMGMAGYEEGVRAIEMGRGVDVGGMMRAEDGGYKNAQERIKRNEIRKEGCERRRCRRKKVTVGGKEVQEGRRGKHVAL